MIYLAEITAGLPTSTGRNIVWGTRRKIYKVEVGRLRKKIRDILPCVSVISSTRLWKRHLCQALNIALNTPIQGIDPDGICVLPSRRSERANFTKIPRSELSTFSKLIPISRKKKKFLTSSPPSSLLFLAEYFNKTLRELMEKRGNKKKMTLIRFVNVYKNSWERKEERNRGRNEIFDRSWKFE